MAEQRDAPADANEHCPGPSNEGAGTADACAGCPNQAECASAPKGERGPDPDAEAIARRLAGVKHVVLVLSGKGGVGKSTTSAQLAFALAARGREVGLMDVDICGPSLPRMLGLEGEEIHQSGAGWSPVYVSENLGVMSIGFMLPDPDDAVIWRGPRKNGLIKQFLRDVDWGPLDYLVIDSPPGTSDEHISVVQLLQAAGNLEGAVIVTTPQEVACADVRKEASFCRKTGVKVLGVVENMAGLVHDVPDVKFFLDPPGTRPSGGAPGAGPVAGDVTAAVLEALRAAGIDPGLLRATLDVFPAAPGGGGRAIADACGAPLLGSLPLDPRLGAAAERGVSVLEDPQAAGAPCAAPLARIVDGLMAAVGDDVPDGVAGGGEAERALGVISGEPSAARPAVVAA